MYEVDLDWASCGRPRQWAKSPTHPWISPGPDRSGTWRRHCLRCQPVAGRPSGTDASAALSLGQTAGTDNKEGSEPRVQLIPGYLLGVIDLLQGAADITPWSDRQPAAGMDRVEVLGACHWIAVYVLFYLPLLLYGGKGVIECIEVCFSKGKGGSKCCKIVLCN